MSSFKDLIYTPENASREAVTKIESHTPKIEVEERIKANEPFEVKISVKPHPNTIQHSIGKDRCLFL